MTLDRLCPICAGPVREVFPHWYRCRDCGWHGPERLTGGPR